MSEPLRKVGRGGAGNFYTQSDIQNVPKQHEDLEAQKLESPDNATHNPPYASTTSATVPARTGRGGAGNFVSASDLDQTDSEGTSIVEKTKEAVNTTKEKVIEKLQGSSRSTGMGGRGGAGNWRDTAEEEREMAREEEERSRGVREGVERDVEAGLSRPPGAYLGNGDKWSEN